MNNKELELCNEWNKNPLINPITKRKISKTGAKFKELKKLCDKVVIKEKIQTKIDNDRISIFKDVNLILNTINNDNKDNCIKCDKVYNCTIGDFIKIGELISSGSLSGVIYKTTINNNNVSVKIVNDSLSLPSKKSSSNDIHSEIRTLEFLTKYVIKTGFPHFPITYDVLKCDRKIFDKYENIPNEILEISKKYKNGNIVMIMSELADGSLYTFYKKILNNDYFSSNNRKLLLNALGQIFISLIFFHKVANSFHVDCHEGNFLFRKNKTVGGYYHYKIFNKDYYIENLGYIWEIWDFGLTNTFTNSEEINKERIDEIKRPLFSFKYRKPKNLIKYFSLNIKSKAINFDYSFSMGYNKYIIRMFPENQNSKYLYDFFNEFTSINFLQETSYTDPLKVPICDNIVLKIMLKHNLIKDKIESNDIIINKEPYII